MACRLIQGGDVGRGCMFPIVPEYLAEGKPHIYFFNLIPHE
jgi:hypothetical protein